jgi:protein-S-isoprenylcysteine O-methyltransferase Ste14
MKRALLLVYALFSYLVFFVTFLYAIGFIIGAFVPKGIDDGPAMAPLAALLIDLGLLGLFAVQHSGMARRGFKRWITHLVPEAAERSTYVLLSSAALILLFWLWRPLPGTIWHVDAPAWRATLYTLYGVGIFIVFIATFMINHFDLFGLRQAWLGRDYTHLPFSITLFYRIVRHPLMLGFVIAFWATPDMSTTHLLFALMSTGYILVALQLEERDLIAAHGDDYREYRKRVPMLVPLPRLRSAGSNASEEAHKAS